MAFNISSIWIWSPSRYFYNCHIISDIDFDILLIIFYQEFLKILYFLELNFTVCRFQKYQAFQCLSCCNIQRSLSCFQVSISWIARISKGPFIIQYYHIIKFYLFWKCVRLRISCPLEKCFRSEFFPFAHSKKWLCKCVYRIPNNRLTPATALKIFSIEQRLAYLLYVLRFSILLVFYFHLLFHAFRIGRNIFFISI